MDKHELWVIVLEYYIYWYGMNVYERKNVVKEYLKVSSKQKRTLVIKFELKRVSKF